MSPKEMSEARMAELSAEIRALADVETLTPEQRTQWDALTAEYDEVEAHHADLVARTKRAEGLNAPVQTAGLTLHTPSKPEPLDARSVGKLSGAELCEAAKRAVGEQIRFANDGHRESVDALVRSSQSPNLNADIISKLVLTCGTVEYTRAWAKAMSGQQMTAGEATALEAGQDLKRAMSVGSGSAGGFLVPTPLDPTMIITGSGSYNPFRELATVKKLTEGDTWKGVTAGQISASWDAEASAVSDDTATLAQPSIGTFTGRAFIPASFETFEDVDGLAGDVAALFVDARDNLEAAAFTTGSGSQPKGVVTQVAAVAGSRVTTATTPNYVVSDIYKLHQALPPRHRLKGKTRAFMANVAIINITRQFATANNYHAFLSDLGAGQPPQLLGDSLYEAPSMTGTVAQGNDIVLYGDFAKYYIVDKIGLTTEFIPNLFDTATGRPTGQRAWLMHWRVGADVVDADAFRVLRVV